MIQTSQLHAIGAMIAAIALTLASAPASARPLIPGDGHQIMSRLAMPVYQIPALPQPIPVEYLQALGSLLIDRPGLHVNAKHGPVMARIGQSDEDRYIVFSDVGENAPSDLIAAARSSAGCLIPDTVPIHPIPTGQGEIRGWIIRCIPNPFR